MSEPNYSHLDSALMRHIRQGRGSNINIFVKGKDLIPLSEPLRTGDAWAARSSVIEVIELRLQALKECGLIEWNGSRWLMI